MLLETRVAREAAGLETDARKAAEAKIENAVGHRVKRVSQALDHAIAEEYDDETSHGSTRHPNRPKSPLPRRSREGEGRERAGWVPSVSPVGRARLHHTRGSGRDHLRVTLSRADPLSTLSLYASRGERRHPRAPETLVDPDRAAPVTGAAGERADHRRHDEGR